MMILVVSIEGELIAELCQVRNAGLGRSSGLVGLEAFALARRTRRMRFGCFLDAGWRTVCEWTRLV
jgi:hypothetical protein